MNYTTNNGGSAFPVYDHHADGQQFLAETGINMRDYFAAKAMHASMSLDTANAASSEEHARWAYEMADAMLKARGQA